MSRGPPSRWCRDVLRQSFTHSQYMNNSSANMETNLREAMEKIGLLRKARSLILRNVILRKVIPIVQVVIFG
jgi:hypothetical protein